MGTHSFPSTDVLSTRAMKKRFDHQMTWVGDPVKVRYVRAHVPVLLLFSKSMRKFQRGDISMDHTEAPTGYRTTISNDIILIVAEKNKTRVDESGLGRLTSHYVGLDRQPHYAY